MNAGQILEHFNYIEARVCLLRFHEAYMKPESWSCTITKEEGDAKLEVTVRADHPLLVLQRAYDRWVAVTSQGVAQLNQPTIYTPLITEITDDEIPF